MIRTAHDRSPDFDSDTLDLCCGGKKCPKLRDEGDAIVVSDADQTADSIRISETDAPHIIAWLQARLEK